MMTKEEWEKIYERGLRIVAKFDEVQPGFFDRLWVWPEEFLAETGDNWTIEEFLQWQRENSQPTGHLANMARRLKRSKQFRHRVEELGEKHGVNVEVMRGMTRKECEVWAMYTGQPDPYYRWGGSRLTRDIYAILDDHELARPWYGFVLSWAFYEEGSAGFNTLSDVFVFPSKFNPVTRVWTIGLEVSRWVADKDILEEVKKLIPKMREDMLVERPEKRVRGPRSGSPAELWVELRTTKGKNEDEIYEMMVKLHRQADDFAYYETIRRVPEIDPDIMDIYKHLSREELVKTLGPIARMEPSKPYISKVIRYATAFPATYEQPPLPPDELAKLARKRPDLSF